MNYIEKKLGEPRGPIHRPLMSYRFRILTSRHPESEIISTNVNSVGVDFKNKLLTVNLRLVAEGKEMINFLKDISNSTPDFTIDFLTESFEQMYYSLIFTDCIIEENIFDLDYSKSTCICPKLVIKFKDVDYVSENEHRLAGT